MILVIEQADALQLRPLPPEPRHCSLEQALRNMDWPFPTVPARNPRPTGTVTALPSRRAPAIAPAPPVVPAPLPLLAFAAAV